MTVGFQECRQSAHGSPSPDPSGIRSDLLADAVDPHQEDTPAGLLFPTTSVTRPHPAIVYEDQPRRRINLHSALVDHTYFDHHGKAANVFRKTVLSQHPAFHDRREIEPDGACDRAGL
jgi:hypothetical protein